MKVIVEPQNTPDLWRLGGTEALLQIRANQSFDTFNGQYIPASRVDVGLCLEKACPITSNSLLIPEIQIDSTEDSLTNPSATYSAVLIAKRRRIDFLLDFRVPSAPLNTNWPALRLRKAARIPLRFNNTYTAGEIDALLMLYIGQLRTASSTQIGMAMSSAPAVDPTTPIHVSVTDPLWNSLLAGSGLLGGAGRAVLVDGQATVATTAVKSTSAVICASLSEGVTGTLRAVNIVTGVGFNIVSSNPGDAGEVAWMISAS